MKKIFSISLILACALTFTLSSCLKEEEDIFDKSAAERLNEASDLYSSRLTASPNGWAMQLYPTTEDEWPYGTGYLLLCRFNKDHSVNVSMDNVFSDNSYMEDTSLWEVITDNGPVLSFNSHNDCMHAFSDPYDLLFTGDADNPNNESGTGAGGDYEFIIVDAPADASYMMLKGKKRGTYNLLTPIEVGVEYRDYLADVKAFMNKMFSSGSPTFDVMHFGDSIFKMTEASDGLPNIFPYAGNAIYDESFNAFLITKRGNDYYLRFRDKIEINDDLSAQEYVYVKDKDIFEEVNNPACYIEGDNPARFFTEALGSSAYKWDVDEQSDKFQALTEALISSFAAASTSSAKYTFEKLTLKVLEGKPVLQVIYTSKQGKQKAKSQSVSYGYNLSNNGDNIRLTYEKPTGIKSEDVAISEGALNMFPAIQDVINYFNQEFKVEAKETRFLLNALKLTPATDSGAWVTLVMN